LHSAPSGKALTPSVKNKVKFAVGDTIYKADLHTVILVMFAFGKSQIALRAEQQSIDPKREKQGKICRRRYNIQS
jgi:hypothetical protein